MVRIIKTSSSDSYITTNPKKKEALEALVSIVKFQTWKKQNILGVVERAIIDIGDNNLLVILKYRFHC